MEWSNTYKRMKELENKSMMDVTLIPTLDPVDFSLASPEKGNASPTATVKTTRKKSMTSVYLKFFETAPDGKTRRCKFCKQSYSMTTATGNLSRHLSHRHPGYDQHVDAIQQAPLSFPVTKKTQPLVKPPPLDFDHLHSLLVKWLVRASMFPTTFEDDTQANSTNFIDFLVQLLPKEKLHTVTQEVFRSMREDVKASMEKVSSKVSLTLDFWTSFEQVFYMSINAHWIDENWSPHKVLIDVCHIPHPCEGPEIFHALDMVLRTFSLHKRVFSCTHDDSQPAVQACFALKEEFDTRNMSFFFMPCAARTLKFIIEDCLKYLRPILSKIREFVFKLNASAEVAQEFRQLTASYHEGSWKFPLDASAHWTGDYTMLDVGRKASNSMNIIMQKHEATLGSRNMVLSPNEKSAINTLHTYLEPFYKITTDLCTCKVPTAGLILFFMDHVFEITSSFRDTCRYDWLKSAADDMTKRAMNFNTQVSSIFTYLAAILDPRIKKELVPENLDTEKNLEEARTLFARHCSVSQFPAALNGYTAHDTEALSSVPFAEEIVRKKRRASANAVATDELTQFLSEPLAPMSTDVLEWWKANSIRYPRLSVMARDYLSVQGTSVEPNKLFSSRGDDIQKQRFCLPHSSMQDVLCIQSWVRTGYKFRFRSSHIDYDKLAEAAAAIGSGGRKLDKKGS